MRLQSGKRMNRCNQVAVIVLQLLRLLSISLRRCFTECLLLRDVPAMTNDADVYVAGDDVVIRVH